MPLRSAMRLNRASRRRSSRSINRPKYRKEACTSWGGLAVAMRLMKASGMGSLFLEAPAWPTIGPPAAFMSDAGVNRSDPGSVSPEMHPIGRSEIIFLAGLDLEGVVPGIHVAGGADHPELR